MPASANAIVLLPPGWIVPASNAPLSDVAVCAVGSLFSQVMLSPALIKAFCGRNEKFWITTVWLVASAALGRSAPIAMMTIAALRSGRLRRIR